MHFLLWYERTQMALGSGGRWVTMGKSEPSKMVSGRFGLGASGRESAGWEIGKLGEGVTNND